MDNKRSPLDCLTKRIRVEKICFYDLKLLKKRLTHCLPDGFDFSFIFAPDGSSYSEVAILQEVSYHIKPDISRNARDDDNRLSLTLDHKLLMT